ncbi:uncharacterized protein LOC131682997 [Topomyia yanbarensis]|uniref:uncharacterized protein LOC131682997 n=1 Tax=Topomyia yanbarensis TaxID=2498891 RepID=UPI00273AE4CE|nr:uncharacterized protein LOC131682997 [Topomyia yanbarensis]
MSAGECSQPPGGGAWTFLVISEIGCADGRLEFWEGTTGNFKGIYDKNTHNNGVTNIKLAGDKVIVARLSGRIDSLRLETYTQGCQIDWGFTSAYGRTHVRTGSAGSISLFQQSVHNVASST